MKLQKLYSYVRKACEDYQMISTGDRIAIGISGGKDSLALLYALAGMRQFYPKSYTLVAITIDLGYGNCNYEGIEKLCEELQVEYHVIPTQIQEILKKRITSGSYCSLCSKLRKGAFTQATLSYGCNKIAYAHHMDDMIETMLLSLFYEGQFYVFPPVTKMGDCGISVIRPLMYVPEADVIGFQNRMKLPVLKNPCPFDGNTRRAYVKTLVAQINRDNPGVKKRLFHAITEGGIYDWPLKIEEKEES